MKKSLILLTLLALTSCEWFGQKRQAEDEGYTIIQKSIFPGATLAQVYDIVKRIDTHFDPELPASDTVYPDDQGDVMEEEYRYETPVHLI